MILFSFSGVLPIHILTQGIINMATAAAAQIEYSIYTFDMPVPGKEQSKWNKHNTLTDMDKAIGEAKELLGTKKFMKIEVKKKFVDEKTGRAVDMTLKTFELAPKKDFGVAIAVMVALLLGALAFGASFYFTQG
jgi:predicted transglutaminase-like protease